MQKQISEFTIVELKSLAYDQLVLAEQAQNNLKIINTEIAKRNEAPVENKAVGGSTEIQEVTPEITLIQTPLYKGIQEVIPETVQIAPEIEPLEIIDFRVWATVEQKVALRNFLISQNIKFGRVSE